MVTGPKSVRHIGPPTFLFQKQGNDKKGNGFSSSVSIKGHLTTAIMQNEESTTTSDALESMHYAAQAQGSGVLDPTTIEQGAFEAAMDPDGHGLKRQADSDDEGDGDSSMLADERPKKKTRGRVKIAIKFIENKLRRYTTFSKRKTGIMKKVGVVDYLSRVI